MKRLILFICLVTIISCGVRKADGSLSVEEGYTYYLQSSPPFRIRLYGDYRFHSLNQRSFPDVGKHFLKYIVAKPNGWQPELVYAAHTTLQPYYSSVSILYRNGAVDTSLLKAIKVDMNSRLATPFNNVDTVETAYGTASRFTYQVLNPATQIRSSHWEYLVNNGGNTLRLFFWTTNSDTTIISHEIETIVKNIRQ